MTRIKHTIPHIKYAAVMLLLRLQSRDTVLSTNVILCLTLKHGTYVTSPTHWVQRACANREDCAGGAASLVKLEQNWNMTSLRRSRTLNSKKCMKIFSNNC